MIRQFLFSPLAWGIFLGLTLISAFAFKALVDKPGCAISLDKQNVIYIGVDNPVSIVARGVPADQVVVTSTGVTLTRRSEDHYVARAMTPGMATIQVSGGALPPISLNYRVKRFPDPVLLLGGKHRSKTIPNGEFKAQEGLSLVLLNVDFDAKCDIEGYEVGYLCKRQDPVSVRNTGARFTGRTRELIDAAKPGDTYFFDDIKVHCPGDAGLRIVDGLVFKIK